MLVRGLSVGNYFHCFGVLLDTLNLVRFGQNPFSLYDVLTLRAALLNEHGPT